ncbi:anti-sigma factor family protein [Bradyrhizobium murdochi]|uniref:anti-sigma factor family protein n=1 Tax=Bradyrhizobium murdochi TaxID=1038859 RepID=UPI000484162E|nr:zf-HC2 domain-containing protein [Bradyrhizobium murdochi]
MTMHPTDTTACDRLRIVIGAFVDGEADEVEASDVRTHLRTCASCRALAHDLSTINQFSSALSEERAPEHLWPGIAARLEQADATDPARRARPVWRMAAIACAVLITTFVIVVSMLPNRDVVQASVEDFITYRAKGWTVDLAARDGRTVTEWAQARVPFAVPPVTDRIGVFEVGGVRLCWLLERRLLGVTYETGDDRAVLYVMEAGGLSLPQPDRVIGGNRHVAVAQHKGHGVAVWTENDLVFVLVAAEPVFDRILELAAQSMPKHVRIAAQHPG